jgi:hypothetical protein
MAGKSRPRGDDPFLFFEAFQENSKVGSLYGQVPLPITFAAIRFANLTPSADSALDVSIYDAQNADYVANEHFRRNYPGQNPSVTYIFPLGYNAGIGLQPMKAYFLMNALSFFGGAINYPYRIEVDASHGASTVIAHPTLIPKDRTAPGLPFSVQPNKRYTIVAYGPFDRDQARSVVLTDNTPRPSPGKSRLRFFNGGYADLIDKRLQIRIDGVSTRPMSYGEVPDISDPSTMIEVAPGDAKSIELIDAATGLVIYTEPTTKLSPDKSYTVFLSRGSGFSGLGFVLTAVSEDLDAQP